MDKYTLQEQAFKHGYEKGYEAAKAEIVHCKECKNYNLFRLECHNEHMNGYIVIDGFCSYGEKEVKPNISKQTADALNKMGKAAHGGNDG